LGKTGFEWDAAKDLKNQQKHGVSFAVAQYAFADPRRVIAQDIEHSMQEARFYCFAMVDNGVLTVRFTYGNLSFESSARDIGVKEKRSMKKKIKYTTEDLGQVQVVTDFLPAPADLAFREEGIKVTLALSKKSVDFFKLEASKHQTQYQRMIRKLLDAYVDAHTADQN
jgi:uncharacterized DUF497 family protein